MTLHGAERSQVDPGAVYALGRSDFESARLERQADELADDSRALIDGAGLRPGQSAIDLGCGPRGVLDLLHERLSEIFTAVYSRKDADPNLGRRLSELYRQAGLQDVALGARTGLCPPGHSRRTIRADLARSMRAQILAMEIADERELDQLDASARRHLANPDVVIAGLNFLAWGRRPNRQNQEDDPPHGSGS
jgi:hypothetical protein